MLKRLSDAVADGDRVLAVIRGSAREPGRRQQRPHRAERPGPGGRAARRARRRPASRRRDVGYVEAHGTGTALGDPIEVQALGAVLGARPRRRASRWPIGSVKTNIGHLEAAAGVAGLIKAALAVQHGEIPPHLHLARAEPAHRLGVAARRGRRPSGTPWPGRDGRRLAGVSAFGFSGTNAHVVLEQAPAPRGRPSTPAALHVLALSARSESALRVVAGRYAVYLAGVGDGVSLAEVCATANAGRAHFAHRVAIVAATAAEMQAKLADVRRRRLRRGRHRRRGPHGRPAEGGVLVHGAGVAVRGDGAGVV